MEFIFVESADEVFSLALTDSVGEGKAPERRPKRAA
jgi:hypothetical protein